MEKSRLKKMMILTSLSAALLSGCGKKEAPVEYTTEITTEVTTEEEKNDELYNDTINKVYSEYREKSGRDIDITDLAVAEYDNSISYIHKDASGNYIYDKDIRADDPDYTWIDESDLSKMYVVRVNDGTKEDPWYTPVCALTKVDGKVVNVIVNTFDGSETHYASDYYVIIEDAKNKNIDELKRANEDIESGKLILLTKEPNEYNLLTKNLSE